MSIVGAIMREHDKKWLYYFEVKKEDTTYNLMVSDLEALGYKIKPMGRCGAVLTYDNKNYSVTCGLSETQRFKAL